MEELDLDAEPQIVSLDIVYIIEIGLEDLDGDVEFDIDVKRFEENPEENLDLYKGDFLQGFFIKDSVEYEDWYLSERNRLKGL